MTASPTEGRERPVIFSGPMVRAILAGRKTQTRRVIKPPRGVDPNHWMPDAPGNLGAGIYGDRVKVLHWPNDGAEYTLARLPCGKGDRLWVRETWCHTGTGVWSASDVDHALGGKVIFRADDDGIDPGIKWFPPQFLPRRRSRITLEVTEVRVERLASISREDAIAEGATSRPRCCGCNGLADGWSMDWSQVGQPSRWAADGRTLSERDIALWSPQDAFGSFINELHDPRWNHTGDGIFGENPWVAAITFRPVSVPPSGGKASEPVPLHPGDLGLGGGA